MPPDRLLAHRRQHRRLHGRGRTARTAARLRHPAWRQRLRRQRHTPPDRGERGRAKHPTQAKPQMEKLLLAIPLSEPKRHRAHVLPPERLPPRGHPIRPKRRQLPRRSMYRRNRQLLVMSLNPNMLHLPADHRVVFVCDIAIQIIAAARHPIPRTGLSALRKLRELPAKTADKIQRTLFIFLMLGRTVFMNAATVTILLMINRFSRTKEGEESFY